MTNWHKELTSNGFEVTSVGDEDVAAGEFSLRRSLPESLRALLLASNGVYDTDGQWFVIWTVAQIVSENTERWAGGVLPMRLLAFGDDGTGSPFCFEGEDPAVYSWSPIAGDVNYLAPNLLEFWRGWVSGAIAT